VCVIADIPDTCDAGWVFQRYQDIRSRLPAATYPQAARQCRDLGELIDRYDVYLFDAFGVLNVGETPIQGAQERLQTLRRAGKTVAVLTNAATGPLSGLVDKYAKLGFDFSRREIISSREILANALARHDRSMVWGIAAPPASENDELGVNCLSLNIDHDAFEHADGFVLLSSQDWTGKLQARLQEALVARPRPLLVGNPDLAAPREDGFSLEPGTYAHAIADRCDIEPQFFGKPFGNAFDEAISRIAGNVPRQRVVMVGDTLHTDILGGAAAGISTVLATGHGMLQGLDINACISESGIVPDYILPHI
jgi:HAD superfamily hydrolase (TIGR01450 family)